MPSLLIVNQPFHLLSLLGSVPHLCCAKAQVSSALGTRTVYDNHYQQKTWVVSWSCSLYLQLSYLLEDHVIDDVDGWEFTAYWHQVRIPGIFLPGFSVWSWPWRLCTLVASGLAFVAPLVLHICLLPVWAICKEVGTEKKRGLLIQCKAILKRHRWTESWHSSLFVIASVKIQEHVLPIAFNCKTVCSFHLS